MYKFIVNIYDGTPEEMVTFLNSGKKYLASLNKESNSMAAVSADPSDSRIMIVTSADKDWLSIIRDTYFRESSWARANPDHASEIIKIKY